MAQIGWESSEMFVFPKSTYPGHLNEQKFAKVTGTAKNFDSNKESSVTAER